MENIIILILSAIFSAAFQLYSQVLFNYDW